MCTGKLVHVELEIPYRHVRLAVQISQMYGFLSYPTLQPCEYVVPASGDRVNSQINLPNILFPPMFDKVLIYLDSVSCHSPLDYGDGHWARISRTLKLVFAYVDVGRRVDHR